MFINRLFRSAKSRPTARPRPRPAARLSVEPLDDRLVPARLSVGDAMVLEGNAGTQYALVSVTLDAPSRQTVSVNYATADGTARAGSDYGAVSGRLTFAPGETNKTVAVPVYGDGLSEPDETFFVKLSGAQRAKIADGRGAVTIVNDDLGNAAPRISIGDAAGSVVSHLDGTVSGTTITFYVSLATASDQQVTVNYATADGTAAAGVDYVAATGTLTFAPGETVKTVTVDVIQDSSYVDESFYVNLSGASGGAQVVDGQGVGTIYFYVEQPPDCGCECTPDSPYYPNC